MIAPTTRTRARRTTTRSRSCRLYPVSIPSFAKINLGLEVLGIREDGYHELRTIFQSVALSDRITLAPGRSGVVVRCDHPLVPTDERNLAVRAALELHRWAGLEPALRIDLEKRIPVGGGLGGGSSNAAAVLLALDRILGLGLGPAGLHPLARKLGADVPYFLVGGTTLGLARGDEVYPLATQVRAHVVLVDAQIPVSTAAVFRRVDARLTLRENSNSIFRFVSRDLRGADSYRLLVNDLEEAALEEAPALAERAARIRSLLVQDSPELVALSGSGSTYFGLFEDGRHARRAAARLCDSGFQASSVKTLTLGEYRRSLGSP
jgi:4-diphosphocytidyl-2-C-methyl-D-erythritol kinase